MSNLSITRLIKGLASSTLVAGLGLAAPALCQTPGTALSQGGTTMAAGQEDAVRIVLNDVSGQYIVPDNKVLVVEHLVWALEVDSTLQRVAINIADTPAGVGNFQLKFETTQPDFHTFERPLRIVGDGTSGIQIYKNDQVDWRDVAIIGYLRDVPATSTRGLSDVVNIVLYDNQGTFTVPDGKVLVIEHMIWALESNYTYQRVMIDLDAALTGSFQLKFESTNPDSMSFARPFRIRGGGTAGVRIFASSATDWRDVAIFGYLRDA